MTGRTFLPSTNFPEVLTVSRFYVELTFTGSTAPDAYFMECRGIQYSQDVIEVCEVTPQPWGNGARFGRVVRTKIPGNSHIANITLKRGMMNNSVAMWQWITNVQNGTWSRQRVPSGKLVIYTQNGMTGATFTFTNAWPVRYTISDTNVAGGELAIEELEIAVEDFQRIAGQ